MIWLAGYPIASFRANRKEGITYYLRDQRHSEYNIIKQQISIVTLAIGSLVPNIENGRRRDWLQQVLCT
jgi:hypothetical protein